MRDQLKVSLLTVAAAGSFTGTPYVQSQIEWLQGMKGQVPLLLL